VIVDPDRAWNLRILLAARAYESIAIWQLDGDNDKVHLAMETLMEIMQGAKFRTKKLSWYKLINTQVATTEELASLYKYFDVVLTGVR
jgi:hypothetical protein